MKSKFIILILALCLIFTIATVSASEVDEKVMVSGDDIEIESTSIENDLKTIGDNQVLGKTNDDRIQSVKDKEILGDDTDSNETATFSDLRNEIDQGGNITLKHKFYISDGTDDSAISFNTINSVIDGNGAVIDMNGSTTIVFSIMLDNVTLKNLTIKNANLMEGYVICVSSNGAKFLDCNFIGNQGHTFGVVYFDEDMYGEVFTGGSVINCTFINNSGSTDPGCRGGAIYISDNNNVDIINCYFEGNSASEGDDIYSERNSITVDSCIFKGDDTTVSVQIVPPALNVDDFITIANSSEKLTFDLKTNSGMSIDNGNVSISVYNKSNDELIEDYSCQSGEGLNVDLPQGNYYAIFNTEYAKFQPINRTIIVLPKTKYYINVTAESITNMTVTLAAKSNIPKDIIGDILPLILSDGGNFSAVYDTNGIWRAVHTFDDFGTYEVSAYTNLKQATVNNATVTVKVSKMSTKFDEVVVEGNNVFLILKDVYGKSIPNANISYTITGVSNTTVSDDNGSFVIVGEPGALIIVNYAGNDSYIPSNISIKLSPPVVRQSTVILGNKFTQYAIDSDAGERGNYFNFILKDVDGNPLANKTVYIGFNGVTYNRITDENGYARLQINLAKAGTYTFAMGFLGDDGYLGAFAVQKIVVSKKTAKITAAAKSYKASATKKYTVKLSTGACSSITGKAIMKTGKTVKLTINGKTYKAKTNSAGKATFTIKLTKKGTYSAKVKFDGDDTYKAASKSVKIKIK